MTYFPFQFVTNSLAQPTPIIHQPVSEISIHRSEISFNHSNDIPITNLRNLLRKNPPRLLNPKQGFTPRMFRTLDSWRVMLLEMVSFDHGFFYRYLSFEGFSGTTQSSLHVGSVETPQPTPVRANRTGHSTQTINHGGNHADISSPWYSQVPRNDLRQRAKAVLKELYTLKIGFLELVNEGIEPKLLMELYAEIGIEIPLSSPQKMKANGTENIQQGEVLGTSDYLEPEFVSISSSQVMSPQQNRDNASKDSFLGGPVSERAGTVDDPILRDCQSSIDQNHSFPEKAAMPHIQLHEEPRTQISNSIAAQTSNTYPKMAFSSNKLAKTPASTILGKPMIAKSGEKALERKDYIARMLAAKAGRPIPASGTLHITDNALNQPQKNQLKPGSPKQVKPDEEESLLVENLSPRATELDLKAFFSPFPM